jgi:hypothetical protein
LSLKKRVVALVLLAVLPALAIQAYVALSAYQQQKADVQAEVLRMAQYVASEIDRIVDTNRALLVAMAQVQTVRAFDAPTCN